ncbi:hypothetical protein EPUS_00052 [Endocarpon pusillum Z07020]|uniref:Zn(2)-C6 fungal-type domain-containing protein n=1 Tax=Endocarpon pusillum (strain Z07020 / HMAS-L-300199) TaxID=1263415 RepID=U1HWV3_ENDPU|nr:uncharacterized protein EPUS_00052 [Endocarpon pusillum Z07020]ERF75260.1 hypothetical protein EPUS_00052 [Endocarpon pusillum Z07020]
MSHYSWGTSAPVDGDSAEEVFNHAPWPEPRGRDSPPKKTPRTLAPNLTRRSHKKSRGGCLNCKCRKIKCQETKPSCENCLVKELKCEYPSQATTKIVRRPSCASRPNRAVVRHDEPKLPATLSPPTSFNMDDMRCFHHFLTVAYPHLPLGNDSVWVQDIPIFAQQHEYLMHALLALGASHLTRMSPQTDYSTTAMIHQGQAIKGLNEALAKESRSYGESDALLAACYALTFQASYMGDGMTDFITMVRGCALVTEQIYKQETRTAFNLDQNMHFRIMLPRLEHFPNISPTLITPAVLAVEALRPLLRTTMDHQFHASLSSALLALQQSPKAGYLNFVRLYATLWDMSHDQFAVFVDPHNTPAQLLMAHFLALQMLMVPLLVHEFPALNDATKARTLLGTVEWGEKIWERTPQRMRPYLVWSRDVFQTVRSEIQALNGGNYRDMTFKILAH